MQYINGLNHFQVPEGIRTAATFGKFDGLHKGHQKLVDHVCRHTSEDTLSVVCAFDMAEFLINKNIPYEILMTKEERKEHLKEKIDVLIDCPFTKEIYSMEAESFITKILVEQMHICYIAVGTDFTFGHERKGNYQLLEKFSKQYDFQVEVVPKELYYEEEISSTYIKSKLKSGEMEDVYQMLGYPYSVKGEVLHGKQIGRRIGIPTVNIIPEKTKILPPNGVYATKVLLDGKWYESITNIGTKPTVKADQIKGIESYLFDYDGNAYEKEITVELYCFERGEKKFDSLDELKEQMTQDISFGKKYFAKEEKKWTQ